jgi:hypothetical protein
MSTDRELLQAAAKAAGYWDDGYRPTIRDAEGWICIRPADDKCMFQSIWAPLTDDGDALRLAVKLELCIDFYRRPDCAYVCASKADMSLERNEWFKDGEAEAATRRAIVRAAAALGEQHDR